MMFTVQDYNIRSFVEEFCMKAYLQSKMGSFAHF